MAANKCLGAGRISAEITRVTLCGVWTQARRTSTQLNRIADTFKRCTNLRSQRASFGQLRETPVLPYSSDFWQSVFSRGQVSAARWQQPPVLKRLPPDKEHSQLQKQRSHPQVAGQRCSERAAERSYFSENCAKGLRHLWYLCWRPWLRRTAASIYAKINCLGCLLRRTRARAQPSFCHFRGVIRLWPFVPVAVALGEGLAPVCDTTELLARATKWQSVRCLPIKPPD